MNLEKANYLLRFDDVCPTMSRERFDRFMGVVARHGIRPILAVVPENRDPELVLDDPDPEFWSRMRALEAAGATIALHGYRHVCERAGDSLLGLHSHTEFAGVSEDHQREWVRAGLAILLKNGLSPRLFVAPRHGFDAATLRVLAEVGMPYLSDGFASRPFLRGGVVWIPQQLWEPVEKSNGLWTVCVHTNTAAPELADRLDQFLGRHAAQFTSFDEVIAQGKPSELRWNERMRETVALQRIRLRSSKARWGGRSQRS